MNDHGALPFPHGRGSGANLPQVVLRKVTWRLMPFLVLLYIFNIMDRGNVGFARLTMEGDLKMSPEVYDWGIGIFYLGYLAFELPSNLLLRRVGARRWIARIMISWGLVSCLTMAVTGAWSFYAVRTLLGVAEAGFFPGIVLYLTYWFPARERARIMAVFMASIAFASVLSNPLSGAIMQFMDQLAGLQGWQWLFLLEGIPSVVLGFAVLYFLTDNPAQATWLAEEERTWLVHQMAEEEAHRHQRHGSDLLAALISPRVWLLICVYFTVAVGANAAGGYFPTLIKMQFPEQNKLGIGLLGALPHLCAIVGMTLLGAHSDRMGERRGHVAFAAFLASAGWTLSAVSSSPWVILAGFCLAQTGMMSMLPCFWALPTSFLSGAAAAGGIAWINSVANIGGIVGPRILGRFGSPSMALCLFVGGLLVFWVRHDRGLERRLPEDGQVSE